MMRCPLLPPASSNRQARTLPERTSDRNSLYTTCSSRCAGGDRGRSRQGQWFLQRFQCNTEVPRRSTALLAGCSPGRQRKGRGAARRRTSWGPDRRVRLVASDSSEPRQNMKAMVNKRRRVAGCARSSEAREDPSGKRRWRRSQRSTLVGAPPPPSSGGCCDGGSAELLGDASIKLLMGGVASPLLLLLLLLLRLLLVTLLVLLPDG